MQSAMFRQPRHHQGQHPAPLEEGAGAGHAVPEARHATALTWLRPAQMYALDMPPADLPLIGLLEALL